MAPRWRSRIATPPTTPPRSATRAGRSATPPSSTATSAPTHQAKAERGREIERLKLIHMPDFDDRIYDFRTMAERVNARLKDEFGARFVRVRGALKVKCHLMFGILALAVDQIIRAVDLRTAPACPRRVHPRPAQENAPRSGCSARGSRVLRFIGLQLPFPQLAEAHTARNLQAIMSAEEAEHRPRHPPPLHWAGSLTAFPKRFWRMAQSRTATG